MAAEERALAKLPEVERPERALTLHETLNLGDVLYRSGYFKDISSAAQAVVKILRGQELGIGPVGSLEGIYVVEGKTALGAGLIGSLIKRSGRYDYKILELTDKGCKLAFLDNGKQIGVTSFTEEDARRAGLLGKNSWQKYPRNMYFARALSNGARWYCPDVFSGAVYTPEELRDTNVLDAEALVIEEEPKQVEQHAASTEPAQSKPAPSSGTTASNGDKRKSALCETIYQLAHKLSIDDEMVKMQAAEMFYPGRNEPLESLKELTYEQLDELRKHYYDAANKRAKGQVA